MSFRVEVGQNLERDILAEGMDRNDHVGAFGSVTRGSIETGPEGIETKDVQKQLVQPQTKIGLSEMIEPIPQKRKLSHEFVHGWVIIERPKRAVLSVNVHNITLDFSGIECIEGVSQCISRSPVPTTGVGHENLDGANLIRCCCCLGSYPRQSDWSLSMGGNESMDGTDEYY